MNKRFYLTTPLYYVNAEPHIGHAYTTIAADILNRFRRMQGQETFLLTGTDEHGTKIDEMAKSHHETPKVYADRLSKSFRDLWKHLDIHYDGFIRTTDPRHEKRVQAVFSSLLKSKDIYKDTYKGYYCVPDETFWTATDLKNEAQAKGKSSADNKEPRCPNCGKPLIWVEEDGYFFALSKYQDRLLKHYKTHPEFLQPTHRAPEILRFVESGLKDLSISRATAKVPWGIPVPNDKEHTIYVWFDALLNYITAAGYAPTGWKPLAGETTPDEHPKFDELWPADVHLVGKEIYRFHAVIWPAMLMALGLPLPKAVFAHGWWTVEGEKMSKSKGNFIDPHEITREFGVDALRYFLFREMPFGNDGDFSRESLRKRYNSELANDLGNLVSRVTQMVDKYLHGELPRKPPIERPMLSKAVADESKGIYEAMERLAFGDALNRIWACVGRLNAHVDKEAPWKMGKSDSNKLKFLLFDLVWSLRIIAGWIYPFMPQTAANMQMQLGVRQFPSPLTAEEVLSGEVKTKIQKAPPLFPRK
jgi:methionyl-tRNA synthetase